MNILYILLALGIIGHAINMYCDRILSIFPNGTLKLANYSKLKDGDYAAKLMEGVSPSVPMRSGVLGVFAIVLEFCGYAALAAYAYQKAPVYGAILFAGTTFACIVSSAYHLKCGLAEYMFLKYGRDERAKGMMLDLMGSGASLRLCSLGMITFYITLMVAIITGAIGFPIWALVFTILPIFLVMFPLQIVGHAAYCRDGVNAWLDVPDLTAKGLLRGHFSPLTVLFLRSPSLARIFCKNHEKSLDKRPDSRYNNQCCG